MYTKLKDLPPPKFTSTAVVENSLIADGSVIAGTVRNSVVFRNVRIKVGAVVENSIIMENTVVEEGAVLRNVIIDKNCIVREGRVVEGSGDLPVFEKRAVL